MRLSRAVINGCVSIKITIEFFQVYFDSSSNFLFIKSFHLKTLRLLTLRHLPLKRLHRKSNLVSVVTKCGLILYYILNMNCVRVFITRFHRVNFYFWLHSSQLHTNASPNDVQVLKLWIKLQPIAQFLRFDIFKRNWYLQICQLWERCSDGPTIETNSFQFEVT